MLQRLFIISVVLLLTVALAGIINPALALQDIPTCTGFAGESAMRVVDGVTHLTYSSMNNQVIYVQISQGNTCVYHIVETFATGQTQVLPTLEMDGNIINIFYSYDSKLHKAVSTNGGVDFTTSEVEQVYDTFPIVKKNDGVWTSFITPYDAFADNGYLSFSNLEETPNETTLSYFGPDEIYGPIRSNSDISIRQYGGGNNNGWPTFYGPVYTSGVINSFPGIPPYPQVFRGGYFEHVPVLNPDFETMNWQIRHEGQVIGQPILSEATITFITVQGGTYSSMIGEIRDWGPDTLDVWTLYPPRAGTYLFRNRYTRYDTLWTTGPSGNCSEINIVNSHLWIRGTFSGNQTWYSPYDIMINDDILLQNTPAGQEPALLSTDHVALISDKRILVQYGYRSPQDSLRHKPNCGSDADGVFIYASLFALKPEGAGNIHQDGCFTFEYQHPHPSVPAVRLGVDSYVWGNIDLHRYKYPQTASGPWPENIDYPYYNPLWPEANPYMERGTIHLYGSVYQQRKGFLHRSINDTEYPNPTGIWDIENDLCGGTSGAPVIDPVLGFTMYGINTPGATGSGVGYKKDYHADSRLTFNTFSFNPFGLGMRYKTSTDGSNWNLKYYKSLNEPVENKTLYVKDGRTAMLFNQHILWQATPEAEARELAISLPVNEKWENLVITNDSKLMLKVYHYNLSVRDSVKLLKLNPATGPTQLQLSLPVISKVNTLYNTIDGVTCFANLEADGNIRFYASDINGNMHSWTLWNPEISELTPMQFNFDKSRLTILSDNADSLYVLLSLANLAGNSYTFYYAKGAIEPVHNQDVTEPDLVINTKVYPNPFKHNLTLKIEANKSVKTDISIYNLKGQKVKTLCNDALFSKGEHELIWNGTNEFGKTVSNGVYFLRGNIGNKAIHAKLLLLK